MSGVAPQPLCVLRQFRPADTFAIKEIISEATMETVGDFFWAAVFSEILPQLAFLTLAIGFVMFGLPFYFCLSMIPTSIALLYAIIWSAHAFKVMELHDDLSTIQQSYQNETNTGFWVAEVHEAVESTELAAHLNLTNKVRYEFLSETELDTRGENVTRFKRRTVAGCIAVTHSRNNPNVAWLRRFAVKKEYRRRGVASSLLETVITFCRSADYNGIELLTTHCHHQARGMYDKSGFTMEMMYNRFYLNVAQSMYMFRLQLKRPARQTDCEGGKEEVKLVRERVDHFTKKVL